MSILNSIGKNVSSAKSGPQDTDAGITGADPAVNRTEERANPLRLKDYVLYYLGYTALFAIMAAAVFVWFWIRKKRFVWKTDGINQHYYGLVYFSRWGKEILRQFRETGVWKIPTFSLRMGYGEDLFTTLTYYVIGDPFSLPAVFIPEKYLLAFHDLMLLVRFWLAGITFSAYCFYMKRGRAGRIGVLAGALIYIFNGFTMSGMRHHYFLNPFIFFPLLLLGCERFFRKKKPGLFILMVFVTAVSNFYFFYMMVLMTVLYAVWRSIRLHGLRSLGAVLIDGISFLFYGAVGVLLAAFVFLPVVLRFLQDPRSAEGKSVSLLWSISWYRNFLDSFLTNGTSALAESWTYMGFGAAALVCVLFIFVQRKKHFDQKISFIGLTALLMTPVAGYVINGFSYPANRWMWAYALLIGYMAATAIPELMWASRKQFAALLLLTGIVVALCVGWQYTFSRDTAQSVIIALFGLGAVMLGRMAWLEKAASQAEAGVTPEVSVLPETADPWKTDAPSEAAVLSETAAPPAADAPSEAAALSETAAPSKLSVLSKPAVPPKAAACTDAEPSVWRRRLSVRVQAAFLACVMLTIVSAAYFDFSPSKSGKTYEYMTRAQIETDTARDAAAASELIDRTLLGGDRTEVPFYRYTTYNPENNTSMLYGVSNTQYYWSLSNSSIAQFLNETGQLNRMIHQYDTLDDRTALNEIAGIRYFLGNDSDGVPYGYEKIEGLSYDNNDLWPDVDDLNRCSYEVYENKYALPLGFTTNRWISREDYDAMDIPQRQQALLQGIVLEEDPGAEFSQIRPEEGIISETAAGEAPEAAGASEVTGAAAGEASEAAGTAAGEKAGVSAAENAVSQGVLQFTDRRAPVEIEYDENMVTADGLSFEVKEGGAVLTMRFAGEPDCETGLYVRGLRYEPPAGTRGSTKFLLPVTGYAGEEKAASKQIGFTTSMDPWTTGRSDYLVNMIYREEAFDRIELTLPAAGTFSFDSIEVVFQPMASYDAQASALQDQAMTDIDIHETESAGATERITGHVELTEPRILCLQIPRTAGWTAYIDGARAQILQADTMFSALTVPAGSHDIELRYQTPGLRLGFAISVVTLLLLVVFLLIYTIVLVILRSRERRRQAVPAGTYTTVPGDGNTPEIPEEK